MTPVWVGVLLSIGGLFSVHRFGWGLVYERGWVLLIAFVLPVWL